LAKKENKSKTLNTSQRKTLSACSYVRNKNKNVIAIIKKKKSKIMQGNKHACVYQDIICASFWRLQSRQHGAYKSRTHIMSRTCSAIWYAGYGQVRMNRINWTIWKQYQLNHDKKKKTNEIIYNSEWKINILS